MRLNPRVGLGMPREVPSCGVTINGCYIPEKYIFGMNPAVVQYDTHWFGPDAEQYNPDRWLGADGEHMEKAMLHFGYGTRICLGKNVSLSIDLFTLHTKVDFHLQIVISELYKLVPQLLREFHLRPANPARELESRNYWFKKVINEDVYFEERVHL